MLLKLLKHGLFICILMTLHQMIETHHHGNHYKKCGILIIVDDSVMEQIDHNKMILRKKLDLYIKELNEIYRSTILAKPPHNKVFLQIDRVKYWKEFLPGCNDGNVCTKD